MSSFAERYGLTFPVLHDDDDEVARAYGVEGIPATVVVDAQGRWRYQTTGFFGHDTAREQETVIKELLKDLRK